MPGNCKASYQVGAAAGRDANLATPTSNSNALNTRGALEEPIAAPGARRGALPGAGA